MTMESTFFEKDANLEIKDAEEQEENKKIVVLNRDEFEDYPPVMDYLEELESELTSGKQPVEAWTCAPEDEQEEFNCEAVMHRTNDTYRLNNLITRYNDIEHLTIYTKKAKIDDNEMVV